MARVETGVAGQYRDGFDQVLVGQQGLDGAIAVQAPAEDLLELPGRAFLVHAQGVGTLMIRQALDQGGFAGILVFEVGRRVGQFHFLVFRGLVEQLLGFRITVADEVTVVRIVELLAWRQRLHPRDQPDNIAVLTHPPGQYRHAVQGIRVRVESVHHLQSIELRGQANQASAGQLALAHALQVDDPSGAG